MWHAFFKTAIHNQIERPPERGKECFFERALEIGLTFALKDPHQHANAKERPEGGEQEEGDITGHNNAKEACAVLFFRKHDLKAAFENRLAKVHNLLASGRDRDIGNGSIGAAFFNRAQHFTKGFNRLKLNWPAQLFGDGSHQINRKPAALADGIHGKRRPLDCSKRERSVLRHGCKR